MAWYIDKDKIDDGKAVGQWNSYNPMDFETCKKLCKERFRMSDDDGEVYYYGWSNDSSSSDPLDDFGMPNAGCTTIEYLDHEIQEWDTL